ncbi:nuclease-related domain-containing protein [Nocardia wallacei]|uniref:nuclease-related domain-containing protein n=1 Tax=Nocardia wallacei TaxID=480035 RepID=UPI002455DCB8|nr:nuclease-related domain-containing protein [Nocardia wallacei]
MRVIDGGGDKNSGAERQVAAWLESCRVPGVAVWGAHIPDRKRPRTGVESDFVVFTPHTAAVIEVKGPREPVGGVLSCPKNAPWSLPGIVGDPLYGRGGDTNPLNQVGAGMNNVKHLAETVGGRRLFVSGLVVVVPVPGFPLTLDKGPMPTGRDVLLGDSPVELYSWLSGHSRRREMPWTAELVAAILADLRIGGAVTVADLARDGFPATTDPAPEVTAARPVADPDPGAVRDWAPPTSSVRSVDYTGTLGYASGGYDAMPSPSPWRPPSTAARSVRRRAPGASSERAPVKSAVAVAAAIAVLGGGIWYLFDQHSAAARIGSTPPATSAPAAPTPVAEAPPAPEPLPAPRTGPRGCYPLQPDC